MNKTNKLMLKILKKEEIKAYNNLGLNEIIYTYKMQLFIISCKSLTYKNKGIGIDYNRFNEEIKLLKYYINGSNEALKNLYKDNTHNGEDDSISHRILPIIISNDYMEVIEEELIKNTIFTTTSPSEVNKGLLYGYIIYEYINNEEININNIKDNLIKFSIKDYKEKYKFIDKSWILNFEKERIKALQNVSDKNYIYNRFTYLKKEDIETQESKYENLIKSFSEYLIKLKKGNINIEDYNDKVNKKFKIKEGNTFDHYLLGKSKIIKNNRDNFFIKTKYGLFKFKKN